MDTIQNSAIMSRKRKKRISKTERATQILMNLWMEDYNNEIYLHQTKKLPLRRDVIAFIEYIRDHKVVGARNTGNLPLKVVHEVNALCVEPIDLSSLQISSESDCWSVYFLHVLVSLAGYVDIPPGRRGKVTPAGEMFLELEPLLQMVNLLVVWWEVMDSFITFPTESMAEGFPLYTLIELLKLPVGEKVPFRKFFDALIQASRITRIVTNSPETTALRMSIMSMVVDVLQSFGAMKIHFSENWEEIWPESIELSPLGKCLLEAVCIKTAMDNMERG